MGKSIWTKEYGIFTDRLRLARLKADLTQVQVAKRLKRPQSYISKVESGEQRVDILELKKFAQLYNRSIEYFLKD